MLCKLYEFWGKNDNLGSDAFSYVTNLDQLICDSNVNIFTSSTNYIFSDCKNCKI